MSGWAARAKAALEEASEAAAKRLDLAAAGPATADEPEPEAAPFGAPPPPAQPIAAIGAAMGETYATVCWGLQLGAPTPDEFEVECAVASRLEWWTASIAECAIEQDEQTNPLWVAAIDELEPGEGYLVRVRARNDAGVGLWSESSELIRTLSLAGQSPQPPAVEAAQAPGAPPLTPRDSGASSSDVDFGSRDMSPQSSREEAEPAPGLSPADSAAAPAWLGGFAKRAEKLREDATGVALKVKGDLAEHVSAALEETQREEDFDETIVVPPDVLGQAQDLLARSETAVDMHSRRHWAQLRRLWLAAKFTDGEDVPLPPEDFAARSPRDAPADDASTWTRLGFQNEDPSTDFRGGGLLALESMLHFAENHPTQYRAMLMPQALRKAAIGRQLPVARADGVSVAEEPEDSLPVALTSINITCMLLSMLSLSRPSTLAVRGLGAVETVQYDGAGAEMERQAFFELHAAALLAFDRCWQVRAGRWADFDPILVLVQRSLRTLLLKQGEYNAEHGLRLDPTVRSVGNLGSEPEPEPEGDVAPPVMRGPDDSIEAPPLESGAAATEAEPAAEPVDLGGTLETDAGGHDGEGGEKVEGGIEVAVLQEWAKDAAVWGVPDSILGASKDLLKSAVTMTRERTSSVTAGVTASGVLGSLQAVREGAEDLIGKSKTQLDVVVKGQPVAVLSQTGVWRDCRVVEREELHGAVKVHYEGFDPMWDEWLLPAECKERVKPRTVVPTVSSVVHSRAPTTSSALDAIVARDSARAHDTPTGRAEGEEGEEGEDLRESLVLETMSVAQLRAFISSAGLSHADCLEKSEMLDRAREAQAKRMSPTRCDLDHFFDHCFLTLSIALLCLGLDSSPVKSGAVPRSSRSLSRRCQKLRRQRSGCRAVGKHKCLGHTETSTTLTSTRERASMRGRLRMRRKKPRRRRGASIRMTTVMTLSKQQMGGKLARRR